MVMVNRLWLVRRTLQALPDFHVTLLLLPVTQMLGRRRRGGSDGGQRAGYMLGAPGGALMSALRGGGRQSRERKAS